MEPTLREGDRLLVRYGARPHTGDLVLVRLPDGPHGPRPLSVKRLTRVETDGSWWVESDNLGAGSDSWTLGALALDRLVGRVVLRLVLLRLPRRRRRGGPGR